MPGNKKAKKKYTPKPVYFPNIVNSMFAFNPLMEALDSLIQHGTIMQDEFGKYIYRNSVNENESFVAGLEIYRDVVKKVLKTYGKECDLTPLDLLREEMLAMDGFEEETILDAKICLEKCKQILSSTPTLLVRKMTLEVGAERALNDKPSTDGDK